MFSIETVMIKHTVTVRCDFYALLQGIERLIIDIRLEEILVQPTTSLCKLGYRVLRPGSQQTKLTRDKKVSVRIESDARNASIMSSL